MKRVTESFLGICLLACCIWWEEVRQFVTLKTSVFDRTTDQTSAAARASAPGDLNGDKSSSSQPPLFILHVGPSKTGTSTLQFFISEHEELLEKDKIHYLGHHRSDEARDLHEMLRFCDDINNPDCDKMWQDFTKTAEYHYSQNHTVFASEEMVTGFKNSQVEQEHLWKYLVPLLSKWRVKIIFTYRRLNEWIPSKYHQAYSPKGSKYSRKKRTNWPDQGGRAIRPFVQYLDKRLQADRFAFLPAIKKRWEAHFPNDIWVFNMHQEGDFVENFFCQMIPEAKAACKYLKSKSSNKGEIKNPSTTKKLHFDMLAVQAYKNEWVDKRLTRKEVVRAVEQHAKTLGLEDMTDFPLDCLSTKQAELLLNQSLAYELDMVPKFYASPKGEQELKAKFALDLEKGKFCSVHVTKALRDERWQQFFENLSKEQQA